MTDPYKILGVSPDVTDDQLKTAYREMARKYHPDNYQDNPLSDLASDKMIEINNAYDQIMAQRKAGSSTGYAGTTAGHSQFEDIRRLINARRLVEAEELLDGVSEHKRDAEWYFLKGSICYSKGWLDDAVTNFGTACRMNPNNAEYQAAYNKLLWQRQNGQAGYGGFGGGARPNGNNSNCSCCDICAAVYCTNCLCDMCGGGCC